MPLASNIRAFVHWREPTVYAGEELECIITFKNVAVPPGQETTEEDEVRTPLANGPLRERKASYTPSVANSRRSSITQGRAPIGRTPSATTLNGPAATRGHKPTLSLNVVSGTSRGGIQGAPSQTKTPQSAVRPMKGHGRSLSIMSLSSDVPSESKTPTAGHSGRRPSRGHGRSASLQYMSRPPVQSSPSFTQGSSRQPSPLYESTTPPALPESQVEGLPARPQRRRPGTASADTTPQLGKQGFPRKSPDAGDLPDFSFPAQPRGPSSPLPQEDRPKPARTLSAMHSGQQRLPSPRPPDGWSGHVSNLNPISRVLSESSTSGTPRSSSEFYSMSNHSDETLTSEQPSQYQQKGRLLPKPTRTPSMLRSRQSSYGRPAESETLMMGYAQTMGHFTLDGSLVNAAPFEEVKRKGVQGGGGVVGLEKSKRSSGMFGAFGWGNIGESLGGLLGGDDMSSIAQMKASAGSKAVPLLSTPQSLLFVDLKLEPGESRSYNYRFNMPRGLPPSHRGRAIKVTYHLALGVQRPEGQAVKTIEVPFRVLGSYNGQGETLGHDLMSPYILLQDAARTKSILPDPSTPHKPPTFTPKEAQNVTKTPKQGLEDFLRYTERLTESRDDNTNGALLSPTTSLSPALSRKESIADSKPASIKEAIDFAILRANHVNMTGKQSQSEAQSTNRFNIARSGQPVAVLTLIRAAYKLGEAVIGTLDFTASPPAPSTAAPASTYAVLAELISTERVDPSLALRSANSINRVTRKVHASLHENTLFARQISFNLTIPSTATPTFETTGVSLAWKLKVEFTTQRQVQGLGIEGQGNDSELLEELGSDERGTSFIAKERLAAETFEIEVPLKVYGTPGVDGVDAKPEALEV